MGVLARRAPDEVPFRPRDEGDGKGGLHVGVSVKLHVLIAQDIAQRACGLIGNGEGNNGEPPAAGVDLFKECGVNGGS